MRQHSRALTALLVTSALCAPTLAGAATTAPKFVDMVDDHGVDLTTGVAFVSFEEGGIGSGPGRVSMQRIWAEGFWTDNWTGGLYPFTDANNVTKMYVQYAGISDTFSGSGTTWTSDNGEGSTLVINPDSTWTYTARDGTQIKFDSTGVSMGASGFDAQSCPGAGSNQCHVPILIVQPNGLKFTLSWETQLYCQPPSAPCYVKRLSSVMSSAGYELTASYNPSSPIGQPGWWSRTSVTFTNTANPPSPTPTITYVNPNGGANTLDITDPAGRTWELKTTAIPHALVSIQRPGSTSPNITYGYPYRSNVVTSSTKDGVTNTYSFSSDGSTSTETVTNPLSQQTVVTADVIKGRITSYKDALNRTTSYQYDSNARLTTLTEPEGNYFQYAYDSRGNIISETAVAKSGSGLANIVTSATYPSTCANPVICNEPTSTFDAKLNETDYTYDPNHGGVLTMTLPAATIGAVRPQIRDTYTQVTSATGDPVYVLTGISACQTSSSCTGTADETKSIISYNNNLLPTSVSSGDGTGALTATTAYTYDSAGNMLTVVGPLGAGQTTRYRYDADRELVGIATPDPDGSGPLPLPSVRISYRADGQVSKGEFGTVTDQSDSAWNNFAVANTVDIGFNSNSQPITSQLSSAGTAYSLTQSSYDALGRLQCSAVRMNTAIYSSLPADACTQGTAGSYGPDQITENIYDAASQLTQVQLGVGTSAAATERTLTYNPNGTIATFKDAMNNLTTYVYDGFDRLSQTQYPSTTQGAGTSNSSDYNLLGYDANSNITSRRNRDGTYTSYTFDALNRVTSKAVPSSASGVAGYSVNYGYDLLGRQLTATFASSGHGITNTYDALGRLTSSSSTMDGTARTMSSQYDLAGNRTALTGNVSGYSAGFIYDTINRMTAYQYWTQIGYDNLGRRSAMNWGSGSTTSSVTYGYDTIDRLTSLAHTFAASSGNETLTMAYDPASQLNSRTSSNDTYAYNGLADVNRNYSANGLNQYSNVGGANYAYDANGNLTYDGQNWYAYDAENKLVSVAGAHSAILSYDPLGRLWQLSASSATTDFIYDGDHDVIETDGAGNSLRAFVWGAGADEPLMTWWESSSPKVLHADERGSIISIADSSGNMLATNSYDEYGAPGSANSGRFQYTGQAYFSEIGLYYYKARMYSPTLGRFLQTDPIGYTDGPNWYAYAHNDPADATDPLGLSCSPGYLRVGGGVSTDSDGQIVVNGGKCVRLVVTQPSGSTLSGAGGGNSNQSVLSCIGNALQSNWKGLALDAGGWLANSVLAEGSVGVSVAGAALGAVGLGVAVSDAKGFVDGSIAGVLAYTGKQAAVADGLLRGSAQAVGRRVGFYALGLSTLYDARKVISDYGACRNGADQ